MIVPPAWAWWSEGWWSVLGQPCSATIRVYVFPAPNKPLLALPARAHLCQAGLVIVPDLAGRAVMNALLPALPQVKWHLLPSPMLDEVIWLVRFSPLRTPFTHLCLRFHSAFASVVCRKQVVALATIAAVATVAIAATVAAVAA